jgi:membrane fusion protein (multidrug efflux system)
LNIPSIVYFERMIPCLKKTAIIAASAGIFLCIIFLARCNTASSKNIEDGNGLKRDPASAGSPTGVYTSLSAHGMFHYLISTNGKINSLRILKVTALSNGMIADGNAVNGKHVPEGSTILQLETTTILHKLERARLTKFNSEKEYESQLLGYENLLKARSISEAADIQQKLRISTGLSAAEQDIKEAQYELAKATVRAPFKGVLADVKVQAGQSVVSGNELFTIYDPFNLFLEVKILEADVTLIKRGMPADIAPISSPEQVYRADVYEINPFVDENGLVLVKLKVHYSPDQHTRLFPGMNCTAAIKVAVEKSVLIPKEAIVERSGRTIVFTLEEGEAKWNYVTVGRDNGKVVQVKSGLRPNMKVITSNNLQLTDNAPVQELKDSLQQSN